MKTLCRRWFLFLCLLAPLVAADWPPNIVLILADDLGVMDVSCYGAPDRPEAPTPHLARLAAASAVFDTAYCAQPICSASRAALLTGKHPARLHLTNYLPGRPDAPSQKLLQPVIEGQLPLEEVTLAEVLRTAGYATAAVGKWHLGGAGFEPTRQGFDTYEPGATRTTPDEDEGSKGEMALTARAIQFLDEHRAQRPATPFFLYVAHDSPHIPFRAQPEEVARHAGAFHPEYAAVVASLDRAVGRLLDALQERDLAENTLVIFTSDNGGLHVPEGGHPPPVRSTPWRAGKGFLYEGGLRVPLLLRWPGVTQAGARVAAPVALTDLLPTLIEAAGLEVARTTGPLDGVSLLPLLRGEPPAARALGWHFPHYTNQGSRPAGAWREGAWKLLEHYEDGRRELFHLDDDPSETRDLAAAEPERASALHEAFVAWKRRLGAQENAPNPDFDAALHRQCYVETDVTLPVPPADTATDVAERWRPWRQAMNEATRDRRARITPATGDLRLSAREAVIHGDTLRYEPEPWKNTLGYWTKTEDHASWEVTAPVPGRYEVEIQQGCGQGQGGSEVEIVLGDQRLPFTVVETGHFQHFIRRVVGVLELPAGPQTLTVRPQRRAAAAIMDLRSLVLRPAETAK